MSWWIVGLLAAYTVFITEAIYALHHAPLWIGTEI